MGRGVTVEGAGRPKIRRRSFRSEELTTLFGSELFLHPTRLLARRTKVSDLTLYWLFLFGVTSGARIEEMGQAHVADIVTRDEVLHVDIDDYVDDQDDDDGPATAKSVKTEGSRRVVPYTTACSRSASIAMSMRSGRPISACSSRTWHRTCSAR